MNQPTTFIPQPGASLRILLINGAPASGKTWLGRALIPRLNAPLLSLDTVKEAFFDQLGTVDRELNRRLGQASLNALWDLAADFPPGSLVMVEAYFGFAPYRGLLAGLRRAGAGQVAEIFCRAPAEVLAERYLARVGQRHPAHPGPEYLPDLLDVAAHLEPVGLWPVLQVDTGAPEQVELEAVARWLEDQLH